MSKTKNMDTVTGLINFKNKSLCLSYSYDYNFFDKKLGSHEISITFDFHFYGKKLPPKNVRYLRCPIPNF